MSPEEKDRAIARAGRQIALLIAGAGVLAIVAPWLVLQLGLEARYEFLFYLISMACFLYAMITLWSLWKTRKG